MQGSLNYYKAFVKGITPKADKCSYPHPAYSSLLSLTHLLTVIPQEKYTIDKPVLFMGCLQDAICIYSGSVAEVKKYCTQHTIKEIDATHWALFSHPETVTQMLLEWVEKL